MGGGVGHLLPRRRGRDPSRRPTRPHRAARAPGAPQRSTGGPCRRPGARSGRGGRLARRVGGRHRAARRAGRRRRGRRVRGGVQVRGMAPGSARAAGRLRDATVTGAVSSTAHALPGTRGGAGGALAVRASVGVLLVLCSMVSIGWLAVGAIAAAAQYWPAVARSVGAAAADGSSWAQIVASAAPASEPLGQAVLDFGFSTLNLVLAVVLLIAGLRETGMRTWPLRLLAVALVGSAGAFNLQAHAAARAVEAATGLAVSGVHQVVLHSVACAAYILALLVFPTPSWDGLPGARPAGAGLLRGGLLAVGVVTFLLVGLGTALLPHTTSCVVFFGFLVPAVGL